MIKVVVNPAGAGGKTMKTWQKAQRVIMNSHVPCEVFFSTPDHGIRDIVRELTSKDEDVTLVIFGGDGTMNQAVNGIQNFDRVRVGYIPCGSGNDLGKALGLPSDPVAFMEKFLEEKVVRTVDVGEAVFHNRFDENGQELPYEETIRRFNISAGIGFDAETCARVDRSASKKLLNKIGLGGLSYIAIALNLILNYQSRPAEIILDNETKEVYEKLLFTAGMNTAFEGGGFKFAPAAIDTDGILDMCIAENLSRGDVFRMFPYAYSGSHLRFKGTHVRTFKEAEIITEKPQWVHTDGETEFMSSHLTLRLAKEKLQLLG